jgi:hypothetical protein
LEEIHKDLKSALAAENKTIVRHLLEKFGKVEKVEEFDFEETEEETENEVKMEAEEETTEREETETKSDASEEEEEEEEKRQKEQKEETIHNNWTSGKFKPSDFDEDKPVVAEDFRIAFEERKRKQKEAGPLSGWEECDIPDCFCKEELHGPGELVRQVRLGSLA